MIFILMAILAVTALGDDLLIVHRDLRDVQNTQLLDQVDVLHVSNDWFLAYADSDAEALQSAQLIEAGPLDLENYSLVHLRESGDIESAQAAGEVLFCQGHTAVVRNRETGNGLVALEGVHLVEPLRVYSEAALEPFRPLTLSNPVITDIVEAVDQDTLIATIQTYEDFVTRLCVTDQFYNSCVWTQNKLLSYGITTIVDDFDFTFYGNQYTSYNVIGEKPGLIEPDVVVIICGHLDSITSSNPMETAPGADDNGSGSAAVVEAARILSDYNFRYTIRFICFGAEELGLIGSDLYAQEAAANGDSIIAVMNLDMILYAPDSLRQLFVPYNAVSEDLAMNMESITETYVPELDLNVIYSPGTTYSDHASFWQQGYPALLGIEQGVNENPYYHQDTDLLANYMEFFPFGTECAKAAIATVAVYADPLPEGIESGNGSSSLIASAGPVPASSVLSISLNQNTAANPVNLTLFDVSGRVAAQTSAAGSLSVNMDVSELPAGIYALQASSESITDSRLVVVTD